jgi:ADP-ribose pyrophosphatase YjhB (NUDIX family)
LIKFPGGGLEWGEGLADGLRREWQEELSVSIDVNEIYYVNEFLQMSTFHSDDQLLSFYYNIDCLTKDEIPTVTSNYKRTEEGESVAWVSLNDLNKIEFTFPVDRRVATMLFESR